MAGDKDELFTAISSMHAANMNSLLVLVQTLEEAGVMQAEHYAANLRMHMKLWSQKIGPMTTEMMRDLADRVEAFEESGSS